MPRAFRGAAERWHCIDSYFCRAPFGGYARAPAAADAAGAFRYVCGIVGYAKLNAKKTRRGIAGATALVSGSPLAPGERSFAWM